jgi:tetratricopeptide (TPR) repeat protein
MLRASLAAGRQAGRVAVAVVHGIAGVGKTQLARAYAERHRADYRVGWWVTAQNRIEAFAGLSELAVRLGASSVWSPAEALGYLFGALAGRQDWLLVLDNAESAADVEEFLPRRSAGGGHVVLTSRSAPGHLPGSRLALEPLALEDASRVLTLRDPDSDLDYADRLAEELGRLPLALEQAAAYTAETGIGVADYLDLFVQERARLLEYGSASAYNGSVSAAITLSADRLASRSPRAHQVLEICALAAPDAVPLRRIVSTLFADREAGGSGAVDQLEVLAALRRSGLVTVDTGDGVRVHRLTRMVTQDRVKDLDARLTEAITIFATLFPTVVSEPSSWPDCACLAPHARAVIERACAREMTGEDLAGLMTRVGRYLLCTGLDFEAARDLHALALAQRRILHRGDHPQTARAIVHLAVDLNELGHVSEARSLHEDALAMRQRMYSQDHADTAHSLDNLGNVLHRLGDHEAARHHHELGLVMRRRLWPDDHPDVGYSLSNLAGDLRALGDVAAARALDEEALAMRRRLDLGDHPDVAHSLSNLAQDLDALGDHAAAAELESESLAMRRRLYPSGHPETAASQLRLDGMRQPRHGGAAAEDGAPAASPPHRPDRSPRKARP